MTALLIIYTAAIVKEQQMERQRQYDPRVIAQPGQARGASVVGPPAGQDWADNLLKTVAGAGSDSMRIIAHDYNRNENALMQEALITADTKFESWKQDYIKEHQGQSALDAQRDFARKYGEIRQETMTMFEGHENEIFRQKLGQSLGTRTLHALQTGGAYQEQQEEIWQKSVFESSMANFERAVRDNPGNEQYIAARRAEIIEDMKTRFPGEDLTARIAKLDEKIANGRLTSMFANQDFAGMENMLGKADGISGDQTAVWRQKLEAGKTLALERFQREHEQAILGNMRDLVLSSSMLGPERQKTLIHAEGGKIADPALRKKAISIADAEIDFQKNRRKAQASAMIYGFLNDARNMTPLQAYETALSLDLAPEDREKALQMHNGKIRKNERNMRALAALRLRMDKAAGEGSPMTDNEIYRYAYDHSLTAQQLAEALKYNGGEMPRQSDIEAIWLELQGENMDGGETPFWLFDAVRKWLPAEKHSTRDEIRRAVSQALVDGPGPDAPTTNNNARKRASMRPSNNREDADSYESVY